MTKPSQLTNHESDNNTTDSDNYYECSGCPPGNKCEECIQTRIALDQLKQVVASIDPAYIDMALAEYGPGAVPAGCSEDEEIQHITARLIQSFPPMLENLSNMEAERRKLIAQKTEMESFLSKKE